MVTISATLWIINVVSKNKNIQP